MTRDGGFTTRDGTQLAFSVHGDPKSSVHYAFLHSLAMDRNFWKPAVERLRGSSCALTLDCRGHGLSGKPAGPYRVETLADDLAQLLAELGWSETIVVGASMGGSVALAFAQRYPKMLAGLGLFDTTAYYGDGAVTAWEQRAQKAQTEGLSALVSFQTTRWFGDAFRRDHPEVVNHCVETFLANDLRAYGESCRMLGAADLRAGLASITTPTRIVVGEEDYATPIAMADSIHQGVRGSRLRIVAGARHLTPLEVPDLAAEELTALAAV